MDDNVDKRDNQYVKAFAASLRALRKREGMTQKELAAKTGVSLEHLNKLERAVAAPSLAVLGILAETFGVPLSVLFSEKAPASPGAAGKGRLQETVRRLRAENRRLARQAEKVADEASALALCDKGRFQVIAESAEDVFWTTDADLTVTYVSPSCRRVYGYDPAELLGQSLLRHLAPTSKQTLVKARKRRAEAESRGDALFANRMELEFFRKSGETVWTETISRAILDDKGRRIGYVGYSRDVTERRRFERRLRRFEHAVSATSDWVSMVDENFRYVMANGAYIQGVGLEGEDVIGRTVESVLGRERFENLSRPAMERCLAGECISYEDWFAFPGRKRFFGNVSYSPWRDETTGARYVVASLRDITERKRTEEIAEGRTRLMRALNDFSRLLLTTRNVEAFKASDLAPLGEAVEARRLSLSMATPSPTGEPGGMTEVVAWSANPAFQTKSPMEAAPRLFSEQTRRLVGGEAVFSRAHDLAGPERALLEGRGSLSALFTPIYAFETLWGAVVLEFQEQDREFTRDEMEFFKAVGGLLSGAVRRGAMEQELLEGRKSLENIINSVPDLLYVKDREHRWILVNDAMCAMAGRPRSALLEARSDRRVFPEGTAERMWETDEKVFESGEPVADEVSLTGVDGGARHFFFIRSRYENSRGERFLAAVGRDISAHKKIEGELRESEKATSILYRVSSVVGASTDMRELSFLVHNLLREILPAENFFIALIDQEHDRLEFTYFENEIDPPYPPIENISAKLVPIDRDSLGEFDSADVIIEVLRTMHPTLATRRVMALTGMTCPGSPPQAWLGVFIRARQEILGLMAVSHYDDQRAYGKKELDLMVSVAEQLAMGIERARTTQALMLAKNEADRASRAKSDFLANMSHEIRTPMNAVLGMTEAVLHTELTRVQREYVDTARNAARHLLTVINSILDLSKIEAGKMELSGTNFSLSEELEAVVKTLSVEADRKNLYLNLEIHPEAPDTLYGDAGRLRQVLVNLVGNAIKFTEKGGAVIRVSPLPPLADKPSGVRLRFQVADTGIGVPRDKIRDIFESFSQADGAITRKYGGTGLGLAICKQLVRMMGGEIAARPLPEGGSEFEFTAEFRTARKDPAAARQDVGREPEPAQESCPAALAALEVLLAEDNPVNVKVAVLQLERLGCRCETAANGLQALKALAEKHFDMVFMDVEMPVMDGLTACRSIRSGGYGDVRVLNPAIPVAALTAHVSTELRQECEQAGMGYFIGKPFEFEELAKAVETLGASAASGVVPQAPAPAPGPGPGPGPGPDEAAERDAPVLDRKDAMRRLAIAEKDFALLLRISFAEADSRVARCDGAVKRNDMAELAMQAHTMKSSLATVGAKRCAAAAGDLEKAAKGKRTTEAALALERLECELETLRLIADGDNLVSAAGLG